MKRRAVLIAFSVLFAVLLVAISVSALLTGGNVNPSFSSDEERQLEQVVDKIMAESNIPGAVIGVWAPGRGTWVRAKGEADLQTGQGVKLTDRFRIQSITKTFTATVILQLVDEKKISLDDKLGNYVARVPNASEITIRQLLDHTSGIYSYTDEDFMNTYVNEPLKKWTPDEIVDIAVAHGPDFPPGAQWNYSDTNYILLGMIIEQLTGNKVEEELQRRIFNKLGLTNTTFPTDPYMVGEYSQGYMYKHDEGRFVEFTNGDPSASWTAGALISNMYDLKRWAKALAEGQLLSEASQREQLTWVPTGIRDFYKYGLGVACVGGFVGHNGAGPGYTSAIYYRPEGDITIVVLLNKWNTDDGDLVDKVFLDITRVLFPHEVPW